MRARISNAVKGVRPRAQKNNTTTLQSVEVREQYQEKTQILENVGEYNNIEDNWEEIKKTVETSAREILGIGTRQVRPSWFDTEYQIANEEKNEAYRTTLRSHCTRRIVEEYKEKWKIEKETYLGETMGVMVRKMCSIKFVMRTGGFSFLNHGSTAVS